MGLNKVTLVRLKSDIRKQSSPQRAKASQWFFKTGKGQYGYGDVFVGLSVPQMRVLAKKYSDLSFSELKSLLVSKFHEQRLIALLILVARFKSERDRVYKFYMANTRYVNNWDLVDLSAPRIVGAYLLGKPKVVLNKLVLSKNIWERRIAVLATFMFINRGQFDLSLKIGAKLLNDKHDLIHKAVGWMLREVGKKDEKVLTKFLDKYSRQMPRITLRYAIEKFPKRKRLFYLRK